jgi:hypothetical protein
MCPPSFSCEFPKQLSLFEVPCFASGFSAPFQLPNVAFETTGSDEDFDPGSCGPSSATPPTESSSTAAWEPNGEARKSLESASKPRLELVPWAAVTEIAEVLTFGAEKYDANNWCRGARWGRYFAALCRHIFAWWGGEEKDPETGKSHLAHAGCCLLFLMEYQRNNWGSDDRFKGPDNQPFVKHDT